ncbi:hypothetical protein LSUE1_G008778, partial [Lachnellula suecica]
MHPLVYILLGNLLNTATAAYAPEYSPVRYFSFLLCLAISYFALSTFHQYINTTGWAGRSFAGSLCTISLVNADRLLIRQWSYGHDFLGPSSTSLEERKKQSRWEFGSEVSASTRRIGSEKEVSNVPYFSTQNKGYTPLLPRFLVGHFLTIIALYYLNNFAIDVQLQVNQELLAKSHITFLTRLSDVSREEGESLNGILGGPILLHAILLLYLRLYSRSIKSGLFAHLETSIRFFGGCFDDSWILGASFLELNVKGPADFIDTHVLQPLTGPLPSSLKRLGIRYTKILISFAVSGAMHVFADTGGSVSASESGAMKFFCVQAAGIAAEDLGLA